MSDDTWLEKSLQSLTPSVSDQIWLRFDEKRAVVLFHHGMVD